MKKLTKAMIYGVCGFFIGGVLGILLGYIDLSIQLHGESCGGDAGLGCVLIIAGWTFWGAVICGIIGVFMVFND